MYVPRPIALRPAVRERPLGELASEVLALSKMNWNSTQFDGQLPVSIRTARDVSDIIRRLPKTRPSNRATRSTCSRRRTGPRRPQIGGASTTCSTPLAAPHRRQGDREPAIQGATKASLLAARESAPVGVRPIDRPARQFILLPPRPLLSDFTTQPPPDHERCSGLPDLRSRLDGEAVRVPAPDRQQHPASDGAIVA